MDLTNPDRTAIRLTIEQQLQAFQTNDAEAAFASASPEIREKFISANNFLKMVKTDYPAVYQPRSVMFERLVMTKGIPTQEVLLLAPNGAVVKALYLMEKQPDGVWKISGCFLVPVPDEGEVI